MTTTPNVELLREVREKIRQDPDSWAPEDWRREADDSHGACRTMFCTGGWAVELAGAVWVGDFGDLLLAEPEDTVTWTGRFIGGTFVDGYGSGDMRVTTVFERARRLLGLTDLQAQTLFYDVWTLDDLDVELAWLYDLAEGS